MQPNSSLTSCWPLQSSLTFLCLSLSCKMGLMESLEIKVLRHHWCPAQSRNAILLAIQGPWTFHTETPSRERREASWAALRESGHLVPELGSEVSS